MKIFLRVISNTCKDPHIRFAGMIEESTRSRKEFSVNDIWIAFECLVETIRVGEFINCEQIEIFSLTDDCIVATFFCFFGCDDLANITVYKCACFDWNFASNT